MTESFEEQIGEAAIRTWSGRSLKGLALLSIGLMGLSLVQVIQRSFPQRQITDRQLVQEAVSVVSHDSAKTGLELLIQNKELREEVARIEERLRSARERKELYFQSLEETPRPAPVALVENQRVALERSISAIGPDQPGLLGPLLEALAELESEETLRYSK
jgi:hypothetical protein